MSVDPTFLLRPKERTLEGVCAYLEADEAELRKEESKSKPDGRVLEELRHRIRVLQLKKAKFERLRDERKVSSGGFGSSVSLLTSAAAAAASGGNSGEGSVSSSPTQVRASFAVPEGADAQTLLMLRAKNTLRKESVDSIDRNNPDADIQTSELLSNAVSLMGDSVDLSRFMAHFADDNSMDFSQTKIIYSIAAELEKTFGFGDEYTAKQIYVTGARVRNEVDLGDALQAEFNYNFSEDFIENIFKIISTKEVLGEFDADATAAKAKELSALILKDLEALSSSLSEGRSKLLDVLVKTVGDWGELLELTDRVRATAGSDEEIKGITMFMQTKKRLGRHIGNLFSSVAYSTSSSVESGAWNLEQATLMLDESVKSIWKVTNDLVIAIVQMIEQIKEQVQKYGSLKHRALVDSTAVNVAKLEKFFGANVKGLVAKKDKYEYVIAESRFDKNLFYTMEGHVKGGTLEKLIEKLAHHNNFEEGYFKAFLVSFQTFTTLDKLVDLLEARFNLPIPDTLSDEERAYLIDHKVIPVKHRVVKILQALIELYNVKIKEDAALSAKIKVFISGPVQQELPQSVPTLDAAFAGAKGAAILYDPVPESSSPTKKEQIPKAIILRQLKKNEAIVITYIDPTEVARQLCLIDQAMFATIHPQEFLKLAWSKKVTAHLAPNIIRIINRATQFTSFVCHSILEQTDVNIRAQVLKHWVFVAEKCRMLHNYNSLMAITAGLMSSSIHRLQRCWRTITRKEMTVFEDVKNLMSYQRNFGSYRKALKSAQLPALPFLGLYLTDLTFIEDGNKDLIPNSEFINFDKRSKFGKVVLELLNFQRVKYNFESVKDIQEYLTKIEPFEKSEEEFYQLSLLVEKKETESDVLQRVLADSGLL